MTTKEYHVTATLVDPDFPPQVGDGWLDRAGQQCEITHHLVNDAGVDRWLQGPFFLRGWGNDGREWPGRFGPGDLVTLKHRKNRP